MINEPLAKMPPAALQGPKGGAPWNPISPLGNRFATGFIVFARVSIFSDLNNLDDLTMNSKFGDAFGFTRKEIENSFGDLIRKIAEKQNI